MTDAAVPLGPDDLEACLELDRQALGGLWRATQWSTELEDPRRPCMGIRGPAALAAVACGWLVADELHVTAVAVDPLQRRRGLGSRVLRALLKAALGLVALLLLAVAGGCLWLHEPRPEGTPGAEADALARRCILALHLVLQLHGHRFQWAIG